MSTSAWFEVGILRGDGTLHASKNAYGDTFSTIELDEISVVAQTRYAELAEKKALLGYPAFNGESPIGLDVIYPMMLSK